MAHRLSIQSRRGLPLVLPKAPQEYNIDFMSEVLRIFDIWVQGEENPGPLRATYLFCDDKFPRNGNHLEEGAVYIDNDTLKVVLPLTGYAPSFFATSSVGTVTTTIV